MKILFITDTYYPDNRAISKMIYTLTDELSKDYSITVLTKIISNSSFIPRKEILKKNLNVLYVRNSNINSNGFILRGFFEILIAIKFYFTGILFLNKKFDLIVSYSPPILISFISILLKKHYNAKIISNIQDIFPDNAVDLKILKNKQIIFIYKKIENFIYKNSDIITSHTPGSLNYLLKEKNIDERKIYLIENALNLNDFKNIGAKKSHIINFGLNNNNIIFLFGGIIGPSQDFSLLVNFSKFIKNPKIKFLVIGDGRDKKKYVDIVIKEKINNIIFGGPINSNEYYNLASECNFGFSILSKENNTPVIPGKIYEFMALKLPILAIVHKNCYAHDLIKYANCGYTINSGDSYESIASKIDEISLKECNKILGINGFNYVQKSNNINNVINFFKVKIDELF